MKFKLIPKQWVLLGALACLCNMSLRAEMIKIYMHYKSAYDPVQKRTIPQYLYNTSPSESGWASGGFKFYAYSKKTDAPDLIPVYQFITSDLRQIFDTSAPPSWDATGWTVAFYAFDKPYCPGGNCITKPIYQYYGNGSIYTQNANLAQPAAQYGFQKVLNPVFHAITQGYSSTLNMNILEEIPLIGQETNLWCWAACTEMVMEYYYTYITQCGEANTRFARNDCCSNKQSKVDSTKCRKAGWFQINKHGMSYDSTTVGTGLIWESLKAEIDATRPVPFAWAWFPWKTPGSKGWTKSGGHGMVATGYFENAAIKMVYITDPMPVDKGDHKWVTYKQFISQPKNHIVINDLYNVQYKSK